MKNILILVFTFWTSAAFAVCPDDLVIVAPKLHEVIGCVAKADAAHHFKIFDASHQTQNKRKQGELLDLQYKYVGDWTITPTRIQLVPFYLDQLRKYDGKLIFEDETSASYKYYNNNMSHWLELSFLGDGIHRLKQISQNGIQLDAQYNVPQMKSRIKRYGKVIFYQLTANQASFDNLVAFLLADERQFFVVSHVFGLEDNDQASETEAVALYDKLLSAGVMPTQIVAKGVGAVSPIKNPMGLNADKKNSRVELVLRR